MDFGGKTRNICPYPRLVIFRQMSGYIPVFSLITDEVHIDNQGPRARFHYTKTMSARPCTHPLSTGSPSTIKVPSSLDFSSQLHLRIQGIKSSIITMKFFVSSLSFFTEKSKFSKSHFSQNSHFWNINFHKIHI